MAALAPDWLRHFRRLLWNRWTEFNETWQKARSQRPPPCLCFSSRSEKQDGRPGLWLADTFSTSPLKPLNRIQRNLTGSKITTSSTKFVYFGSIGKTRWPPWPLIGWDIFRCLLWNCWTELMKLDRKQDLNVLYQVCVFWADQKNKMATLASDWLRHFRLPDPFWHVHCTQVSDSGPLGPLVRPVAQKQKWSSLGPAIWWLLSLLLPLCPQKSLHLRSRAAILAMCWLWQYLSDVTKIWTMWPLTYIWQSKFALNYCSLSDGDCILMIVLDESRSKVICLSYTLCKG